jgi:selenocysteine lyase/cysteine desulfurase
VSRVAARCAAAGVVVTVRRGRLRVAPHVYNDTNDLDRLSASVRG